MADIIQLRRDTAANWSSINPILADGEPGLNKDTNQIKYGDGVTAWNGLPYASGGGSSRIYNETPAGLLDGANTVFTTAGNFTAGTTAVFINGVRLKIGVAKDYTETGINQITLNFAPKSIHDILIDYDY